MKYLFTILLILFLFCPNSHASLMWTENLGIGADVNRVPFIVFSNDDKSKKMYMWFDVDAYTIKGGTLATVEAGLANWQIYQGDFDLSTISGLDAFSIGSGVSHNLLSNLAYASAGHTGFEEETHASEHASGGGDAVDHDATTNFVATEHIDWTNASDNFLTSGTLGVGKITVTGVAEGLKLIGIDTGDDNLCHIDFYDSNGSTRRGFVGDAASGDDDIVLRALTGDLRLLAAGTVILPTGSTIGNLTLANGSITDSGGAISFGNENLSTTGTLGSGAFTLTQNSDTLALSHDGSNAYIKWSDGDLALMTDEGTHTNTHVSILGKGTGFGILEVYDTDADSYILLSWKADDQPSITCNADPTEFNFLHDRAVDIKYWSSISSGNPYFYIYGRGTAANEYLRMRVESDNDALIEAEHDLNIIAGGGNISFGGEVKIGNDVDVSGAVYAHRSVISTQLTIPSGASGITAGDVRYNSTDVALEYYDGSAWHDSGSPKYIYIKATGQNPRTDINLSDGTNWNTSKALIKSIRVVCISEEWDLFLIQNDNGKDADDATIPMLKIMEKGDGDAIIFLDHPYDDEDDSDEVHLNWYDVDGATHTADIYITGFMLR